MTPFYYKDKIGYWEIYSKDEYASAMDDEFQK
jgi:hypothetical protein